MIADKEHRSAQKRRRKQAAVTGIPGFHIAPAAFPADLVWHPDLELLCFHGKLGQHGTRLHLFRIEMVSVPV